MAGQKRCSRLPGLLLWWCLLGVSLGFVLEEDDWGDLREDLATLHRLRGLANRVTYQGPHRFRRSTGSEYELVNQPLALIGGFQKCEDFASCVMEANQDFEEFLTDLERQKVQDKLLSAEETFHSYDNKLILMMDEQEQTRQAAKLEYSLDPHYSVLVSLACIHNDSCLPTVNVNPLTVAKVFGSASEGGDTFSHYSGSSFAELIMKTSLRNVGYFSFDNATNSDFKNAFVRAFKPYDFNVVLETIKQNEVIYQTLDHTDSMAEYKTQKRPVDHSTRYDGQHILIMEDDPVIRETATNLYEKHPTVSSVYVQENAKPKLIKGEPWPLTDESRLVLVGHGRRGSDGKMKLAGYSAEEVAQIISHTKRDGDLIRTISVVACEVGSDKVFIDTLLQELHAKSIKAELHLKSSLLLVSHAGERITVEITPSGVEYRHKDASKKVVAVLGRDGETVTRVDLNNKGEKVSFKEQNFMLGPNYWEDYRNMWPEEPTKFVEQYARRAHTDDLEGLAWAFFHDVKNSDLSNTKSVFDSRGPEQYILFNRERKSWITNNNAIDNILRDCYEITNGEDFIKLIHHGAKSGYDNHMYFLLHDWIYQVNPKTLYVYPVGKRLGDQEPSKTIQELITQVEKGSYYEIHKKMREIGIEDYANFARDTLMGTNRKERYSSSKELWYGTCFFASVFAESARNFRTFPTILMALDIFHRAKDNNIKDSALRFLIEEHPMARPNSWVSPNQRGFYGTSSEENSSKYRNRNRPARKEELQEHLKLVTQKEEAIVKTWMSVFHMENIKESIPNLLSYLNRNNIEENEKFLLDFRMYKEHVAEPTEMNIPHTLGGNHDGSVTSRDLQAAFEVEHSLKMSAYYSRSSAILAQQIHKEMQTSFGERVSEFTIKTDSIHVEDGKFHCELVSRKDPAEILKWQTDLSPASKSYMDKLSDSIMDVHNMEIPGSTHPHQVSEHVERAGKVMGTVGLIMGIQGAIHAFEAGDIGNGTIATLQTIHGISGMTLAAIGKKMPGVLISKPLRIMPKFLKGTMKAIPIFGIGFGIYSVVEDFQRKDTLGYIDAALDLSIVALDVVEMAVPILEPILAPINLALSVVRMVVDDIYEGIQTELSKLPQDAGFFDKLRAGIVGFFKGVLNFLLDVASIFYSYPYREIENGHRLVEQISDYHKYYSIRKENGRSLIDFTGGESSWNGGSITFHLTDSGNSEFCIDTFVSSEDIFGKRCWGIDASNTQDIVVGIGESHHLTYRNIDIKVLCFIKVGSVRVASGYEAESNTRFGTYYGNSEGNQFYTVQKAEDNKTMEVMLSYYYELYGEYGDDIFFLGPQRSYVEGRAGSDTYIIPVYGGNTIINNYDPLKTTDLLMLSVNYSQISVTKSGADVTLKYFGDHNIRITRWFSGEEYRHINLISADGVLFDISLTVISSVQLIARGVNKMSQKYGQVVNTTVSLLRTVTNIQGSPYNDVLIGNEENNLIDGGGGTDRMEGGNGEDIYFIKRKNSFGVTVIDNHSTDKKVDLLLVEAKLHDFKARVQGNDLILTPFGDSTSAVILQNWFLSENHRHLLVVTEDFISFTVADNSTACQQMVYGHFQGSCMISQSIDYTKAETGQQVDLEEDEALHSVSEVRGSNFDDIIRGNSKHNMIVPGQGNDLLQGRGGEDWYILSPGQGTKTIDNYSLDRATDRLLLKERYSYISAQCDGLDAVLFINNTKEVILKGWFQNQQSQHLQIESDDIIVFKLESNISNCDSPQKYPVSVDFRKRSTGEIIQIDNEEFSSVVEMYGSSGFDVMIGNDQDNMLDLYTGGARMEGGNGKDTYIIKLGSGTNLEINNCAEDESVDVVQFEASFQGDNFTVMSEHHAVLVSARAGEQKMQVRLLHYGTGKWCQHLQFQTADGVRFLVKVPESNRSQSAPEPRIIASKITLNDCQRESHTDLNSVSLFSQIGVVQGCPYLSNHIQGNKLENALFGGAANDAMDGGAGDDTLMGGKGDDILLGEVGDDRIYGEEGDDYMLGGAGCDTFIPGPGKDILDGGSGRDTVLYQGDHEKGEGVYVNLLTGKGQQADADGDVLKDVENVIGTIYPDVLVSGYEPAFLKGSDGNDILVSLAGGDYLIGGNGNDIYLLASYAGSLVIDNCAEDNATDILYLHNLSDSLVSCSYPPDSLSLSFSGPSDSLLEVELRGWVAKKSDCRHLLVILSKNSSSTVSVEHLVEQCEFRHKLMILMYSSCAAVFMLLAVGVPLLLCARRRGADEREGRKERDSACAESDRLSRTDPETCMDEKRE